MIQLKIGYIVQAFPSVTEHFITREIKALRDRGLDIKIFALRPDKDLAKNQDVIYFYSLNLIKQVLFLLFLLCIRFPKLINLILSLRKYYPLKTLIANIFRALFITIHLNRIGIYHVHCHFLTMPALLGYIISELSATTYSLSAHAKDIFNPEFGQYSQILEKAEKIFVCSQFALNRLRGKYPDILEDKFVLAHHGLNLSEIPKIEVQKRTGIIAVGRLVQKKGFIYLLEAMKLLRDKGNNLQLNIYGEGPEKNRLRRFIYKNNLQNNVTISNFIPFNDILLKIAESKLLVLPSLQSKNGDIDGIPNVVLEAMAVHTPVIAGRIPGLQDIFNDKSNILFADPRNTEMLSTAIREALADENIRNTLTHNAFITIQENFNIGENISPLFQYFSIKRRDKISLLLGLEATIGGTRKHIRLLIDHLPRNRFNISFICSTLRADVFLEDIKHYRSSGIDVRIVQMKREISFVADLRAIFHFGRLLMDKRHDVIHLHSSKAGGIGRIAAWLCGYRNILYSPHAFAFQDQGNIPGRTAFLIMERILGRITKKLIAVSYSEKVLAITKRIMKEEDIIVAPNGLPDEAFKTREVRPIKTIGFIGRLERQKGCDIFLLACLKIIQEQSDLTIKIAGTGTLSKDLKLLAKKANHRSIMFTGCLDNIDEFYDSIDLLVMPSRWEGCPYTLLEALQRKVPFLASDIPVHKEILTPNSPCLFAHNNVRSLYLKLEEIIQKPHIIKQSADNFHGDSFIKQLQILTSAYENI